MSSGRYRQRGVPGESYKNEGIMPNQGMDSKEKDLRERHLRHFNRVAQDYPDKPVWWCVAQAIKRFEIMNGERGFYRKGA